MVSVKSSPQILGKWNYIFLMGESGGGKGTLVKNIRKFWLPDIQAASMGDIFREKAKSDPEIKRMTESGKLLGDDIAVGIFKGLLENGSPAIVDGFPRNRQQALEATRIIKELGWRVLVIDIHCDLETIIERLLARGREDDKLEIMHRRNVDHKKLHPAVMEEIRNRHDLFDVIDLDGNNHMDITLTNFMLGVLRLVDMLSLYDMQVPKVDFAVQKDETNVQNAVNRWLAGLLHHVQSEIEKE